MALKECFVVVHVSFCARIHAERRNKLLEKDSSQEGCELKWPRTCCACRPILPTFSFPTKPSGKTGWTRRLDFHWRGRDAVRRGSHQCWGRKGRLAGHCLPRTS